MNITTLARIVARKLDLEVVNKPGASTFSIRPGADGKLVMFCPGFVVSAHEGREADVETLIRGGIAHEALGHGRHTDFDGAENLTPYEKSLVNIIEDIRIERLAPEVYPGARTSLKKMAQLLESNYGFWRYPSSEPSKEGDFAMGMLRRFRTDILHQDLPEEPTQAFEASARHQFGASRYTAALAAGKRGCFVQTTAGVIEAAKEIIAILTNEDAPREELPNPASPEESQANGSESDSTTSVADKESEPGRQDEIQGHEDGADSTDDEMEGKESTGNAGDDVDRPTDGDESDQSDDGMRADEATDLGSEPGSVTEDNSGTSAAKPVEADPGPADLDMDTEVDAGVGAFGDLVGDLTERESLAMVQPGDGTSQIAVAASSLSQEGYDKHEACRIVRLLQGRLGDSLVAVAEDEDDRVADAGRLDTSRLAGIAAGTEREPFTQDGEPGRNIATDLFILFDKSGSMGSLDVGFLRQVLFAMGTVLARFAPEVRFDLAWFDSKPTLVHGRRRRWTPGIANAVASSYVPSGSTDWPASAVSCLPYFDDRSSRRKVLLTVTDGHLGSEDAQRIFFREARSAGIECAFVSVNHDLPHGLRGLTCPQQAAHFAAAVYRVLLQCMAGTFR